MRRVHLLLPLALLVAGPAGAQSGDDRLPITALLGIAYERGGPGPAVAATFDDAGYGDRQVLAGGIALEHPMHYTDGLNLSVFVGAEYRPGPYSVDLVLSNGHVGHAEGYDVTDASEISTSWRSFLATATVGVHLGPVRLGAGPSMTMLRWTLRRDVAAALSHTSLTLGATASGRASATVAGTEVSLAVGTRAFPTIDLTETLFAPVVVTEYRTWYAGFLVRLGSRDRD